MADAGQNVRHALVFGVLLAMVVPAQVVGSVLLKHRLQQRVQDQRWPVRAPCDPKSMWRIARGGIKGMWGVAPTSLSAWLAF